jgi:hypothetical protein
MGRLEASVLKLGREGDPGSQVDGSACPAGPRLREWRPGEPDLG